MSLMYRGPSVRQRLPRTEGPPEIPEQKPLFAAALTTILSILLVAAIYVYSFHRIQSLEDVAEVLKTMSRPLVDDRCRRVNSTHLQCLPNVFFIGASKCGTTSITEYLDQHPQVHFVRRRIHKTDRHREVHRFDRNTYPRSIRILELLDEWASSPVVNSSARDAVIHYTPHYLYAPSVPFDLRRFFPDKLASRLKFIVVLRDPTRRAISSYWFQNSHIFHRTGDRGSYAEFSALCDAEIQHRREYESCMAKNRGAALYNSSSAHGSLQLEAGLVRCFGPLMNSARLGGRHVDKGIYADQLERWFINFPRENFFITSLEQWQADAPREFARLLQFIGVDPKPESASYLSRRGHLSRLVRPNSLQTDPPQALIQRLDDFFKTYAAELKTLLPHGPSLG